MEKKRRFRSLVGDVLVVELKNGNKRYIQFIGWDKSLYGMGADVIRVFKKQYNQNESPTLEEITDDEIDFFAHIYGVTDGLKEGLWKKVGNMKKKMGSEVPMFYQAPLLNHDEKGLPAPNKKRWILWYMDGKNWDASENDIRKKPAHKGGVMPPSWIVERMNGSRYLIDAPGYIQ